MQFSISLAEHLKERAALRALLARRARGEAEAVAPRPRAPRNAPAPAKAGAKKGKRAR
jgi:hypothetical protein